MTFLSSTLNHFWVFYRWRLVSAYDPISYCFKQRDSFDVSHYYWEAKHLQFDLVCLFSKSCRTASDHCFLGFAVLIVLLIEGLGRLFLVYVILQTLNCAQSLCDIGLLSLECFILHGPSLTHFSLLLLRLVRDLLACKQNWARS